MHLLNRLLISMALLCLLGCKAGKTYLSGVVFADSLAYVDGHLYSGELWSDDTVSYCLMAEEGRIVSLTMFHDNGMVALKMPSTDSLICYDVTGTVIPFDSFVARYEAVADEVSQLTRRIMVGKEEEVRP